MNSSALETPKFYMKSSLCVRILHTSCRLIIVLSPLLYPMLSISSSNSLAKTPLIAEQEGTVSQISLVKTAAAACQCHGVYSYCYVVISPFALD